MVSLGFVDKEEKQFVPAVFIAAQFVFLSAAAPVQCICVGSGVMLASGSVKAGEYGRYCWTFQLLELAMPPTAAIALAVTDELPPADAEFDEDELENRMQVGALIVVLPLLLKAVPLESNARMHAVPPADTVPAVAEAVTTGAADMNRELNGSAC